MTEDRRTKDQILAELEKAEAALYDAQARIPSAPARVPEADALATCIRALDALEKSGSTGGNLGYTNYGIDIVRNLNTVQRVIEALSVKYKMPPEKPVVIECQRRHVEDLSPVELVASIQGNGRGF